MTYEEMDKLGIRVDSYRFDTNRDLRVVYTGLGMWAVRDCGQCLNQKGEWDYEPIASSRTDEFLANHRFTLDQALRLAAKAIELEVIN